MSAPTSELFTSYESDLTLLLTDIQTKLSTLSTLPSPSRKPTLTATKHTLTEADALLSQMSLELNNLPSASRHKPRSRLREYTVDLAAAHSTLNKLEQETKRAEIFGNRGDLVSEQRQQLISGAERLERSSQRLRESERLARETEMLGGGILEDLGRQREMIRDTHDRLDEGEGYLDRSLGTIRGMARRWVPGFGI